jgi:hypothetical protein
MLSDESVPTGLPDDDAEEGEPLGVPDPDPEEVTPGEEAMPGIPRPGEEPPTDG